jgi:ABC-type antimicrobial peptide transport system permease subunit
MYCFVTERCILKSDLSYHLPLMPPHTPLEEEKYNYWTCYIEQLIHIMFGTK